MAQDRSTKIISMIEWIWTSRLSIKKSLSGKCACNPADRMAHRGQDSPDATLEATQGQIDGFFSHLPFKCHQNRVASVADCLEICPRVTSREGTVTRGGVAGADFRRLVQSD